MARRVGRRDRRRSARSEAGSDIRGLLASEVVCVLFWALTGEPLALVAGSGLLAAALRP